MIKFLLVIILFLLFCLVLLKTNKYETFENKLTKKEKEIKDNSILDGKVIFIAGATGGIGRELSKKLSDIGSKLIIHGRSEKKVNKLVDNLRINNPHVLGVVADLTSEEDINNIFKKIKKTYPKIYALVNVSNSITGSKELSSKKFKDWKKDITVNVDSAFLLANKLISHMKWRGDNGRIINVSGYNVKTDNTMFHDGSNILSKTFIENFSKILSKENYKYNIAVTTIRIDENINTNSFRYIEKIPMYGKKARKTLDNISEMIATPVKKILPVFLYTLRAPFHEITGKIISTGSYLANPKLSKIIPSHHIILKDAVYDNLQPTKTSDDPNAKYVVKQNPFGVSKKVKDLIKNNNLDNNKFNTYTKNTGGLEDLIAKKLNINKKQITFFKTEYDAFKKVIDLFVPKYQDILACHPCWTYVYMITKEKKINLKYFIPKIEKNYIQPNFKYAISYVDQNTKMIYLSSPNTATGISLDKDEFENFISKFPDNIPIFIDQSFIEFSKKNNFNALDYLDKNVIVMRSLNNFYGFENLELAYLITDIDIANILQKSQIMDMPLNNFNEQIAITAFKDKEHNRTIRKKIREEKDRIYEILDKNEIKYFKSETNYIFISPGMKKNRVMEELEKKNIFLYQSNDEFEDYWTLPLSDPKTNDKILEIFINS